MIRAHPRDFCSANRGASFHREGRVGETAPRQKGSPYGLDIWDSTHAQGQGFTTRAQGLSHTHLFFWDKLAFAKFQSLEKFYA